MADNELFRTTLVGGYDKDDVERQIQKMKDEAQVNKNRLLQMVKQRDQLIQELNSKLEEKDSQLRQKDRDIKEKYQSYIDNYEQIGRLVYESRVRADRMIVDARDESRRIIREARTLARRRLDQVQGQIDEKLEEGKLKHKAVQKELDSLLELLKEVRSRCLTSYDTVEDLVKSYTEQDDPFADIMRELEEKAGVPEQEPGDAASLMEQISFMKNQLSQELPTEEENEDFDDPDDPDEAEQKSSLRRELDDEEEPETELPTILSVEEVLKSIDRQQSERDAVKVSEAETAGDQPDSFQEETDWEEDSAEASDETAAEAAEEDTEGAAEEESAAEELEEFPAEEEAEGTEEETE